ncbi:sensor histidine kinase, partial [Kaarinaea lacus]
KICGSARHLNSIIDDMLDLSKIEAGKFELVPTVVDMEQFIEEIKTAVAPLIEKNNNQLVCESRLISEHAYADSLRLKQVILNLISNAAKFTEQGTITVSVTPLNGFIAIAVKDTGIGMSVEQVNRVFEAFTQADKETTIKYGGTGLGLTISKSLCDLMGGDIAVESQQGKGSTFTVTVPTAYSILKAANDHHG